MPVRHLVLQGEGISSIAERYGFAPWTIWDHPENAALKSLRKSGDVLLPGDEIFIPDLRPIDRPVPTGQRHVFRRRGVPAKLRLRVVRNKRVRANETYELHVDGALHARGRTDGNGVLEEFVPCGAQKGRVIVGADRMTIEVAFGHMDPISEISGVQKRLQNLKFHRSPPSGRLDEATREALRAFQTAAGMPATGEIDDATREKLVAVHDNEEAIS